MVVVVWLIFFDFEFYRVVYHFTFELIFADVDIDRMVKVGISDSISDSLFFIGTVLLAELGV